jgi:toxin ParE1/3/4
VRFRLSDLAKSDLDEIRAYTIAEWGRPQWLIYYRDLVRGWDRIVAHPDRGQDRSALFPNMRSVRIGRHVVFYLRAADGVVIIRLVHERRDMAALSFEVR